MVERVSLNGEIVPAGEARLGVFDAGFSHGTGLFETLRSYGARPFRLADHLARMRRSAQKLSVAMPWEDAEIERGVSSTIQANELTDARIRITITPGDLHREDDSGATGTLLITTQKMEPYLAEYYQHGMTVCVSPFKQSRQDPLAGHKTVSYFPRLLALREGRQRHCGEALWFTTDHSLAEGCLSNVFLVRGEKLLTPPPDTPVLAGIARGVVLECAAARKIPAEECPLTIEDLLSADEVFLTNSIMEVMPVCRIERHAVGDEKVGALTRQLHESYRDAVWRECRLDE